jgi:thermostable 8-oxoguanine DNA glycosylase
MDMYVFIVVPMVVTMIDPTQVGFYNADTNKLEEYLLFCIVVAGKTAKTQSEALEKFLMTWQLADGLSPFEKIEWMINRNYLLNTLKYSKLGQYTKLEKSFSDLVNSGIDLRTCTAEDLQKIHGIGFKTARFFLVYTRKDCQYAILDTHLLKFMRDVLKVDAPLSTPSKKKYLELEKIFLDYVKSTGKTVQEVDLDIWKQYSQK